MFGLYVIGIVGALVAALVLRRTVTKGAASGFMMEMPKYQWPRCATSRIGLWHPRADLPQARRHDHPRDDRRPVGAVSASRRRAQGRSRATVSIAGHIANGIEVVVRPIGFNHDIALALIPAMAAREVAVGAIAHRLCDRQSPTRTAGAETARTTSSSTRWSLPTALAFLAWFVFAPQCISTIAVTRRETNGWKWPPFMVAYLFALAYIAAGATYWLARSAAGSARERQDGGQRQQGHPGRQSRARPRGAQSFQNGGEVVNLRIATSENWKDRSTASARKRPNGTRSSIFNEGLGKVAKSYLRKGSKVYIEGAARRPANGRTSRATTAIRPRSCCRASTASWCCSTGREGGGGGRGGGGGGGSYDDDFGGGGAPAAHAIAPAAGRLRHRPRRRRSVLDLQSSVRFASAAPAWRTGSPAPSSARRLPSAPRRHRRCADRDRRSAPACRRWPAEVDH